jgi:Ras homolog gene family, member A
MASNNAGWHSCCATIRRRRWRWVNPAPSPGVNYLTLRRHTPDIGPLYINIRPASMDAPALRKKLVIVGDGACGKTSLLMYPPTLNMLLTDSVFQKGEFPRLHIPTLFDVSVQDVYIPPNNTLVQLALWDTAGQEEYDRLRPLCYHDSNVILVCFSVDNYDSLENVVEKWLPEVLQYTGHLKIPYILVGTKRDLRQGRRGEGVSYLEGEAIARRIGARGYIECSARHNEGVVEVFQFAAREACRHAERPKPNLCSIL